VLLRRRAGPISARARWACDISLRHTRAEHLPLAGELTIQLGFPNRASAPTKPKKLVAQFCVALQQVVKDWLALGATNTAMVRRLKGNAPQSHEQAPRSRHRASGH
jgi:hypothetical protein